MRPEHLFFRCYARKTHGGTWYAMCIDLNVDAEAVTLVDVKASMDDAIKGYLEIVLETDDSSVEALLRRPAPLSHHFAYHIAKHAPKIAPWMSSSRSIFQENVPICLAPTF